MSEEKVYVFNEDYFKQEAKRFKREKRKQERKEKAEKAKEWLQSNWRTVTTYAVAGIAIATPIVLKVVGSVNETRTKARLEKIERNKEYQMYDRSLGCYLNLKRKLSRSDLTMINRRKQNGETLVDILNSLNLLK